MFALLYAHIRYTWRGIEMLEKLKFNCLSDYDKLLNYTKMIAMMMFPESEAEQKEVLITVLAHVSDEDDDFNYSGIIKELGGYKYLSNCRSYSELSKIMNKKEKEWYTVFRVISNMEKMKYNSESKINKKASLSKSYYLTDLFNKKAKDMPKNQVRIINLWEYYKPAAHFIYAYCKNEGLSNEYKSKDLVCGRYGDVNSFFIGAYDIAHFMLNLELPVVKKPMIGENILYPISFDELSENVDDIEKADLYINYGKTFTDEERKELLKYRAGKKRA